LADFMANAENVAWRVLDGEAVLVHAESSAYYGLNATGTYVWEAIQTRPVALEDLVQRVATRFSVEPDDARSDVAAFLENSAGRAFVSRTPAPASGSDHPEPAGNGATTPYEPPELARFGELEQLVLSGE
jgi:hypothetical protein